MPHNQSRRTAEQEKRLLSGFFNRHLEKGVRTFTIDFRQEVEGIRGYISYPGSPETLKVEVIDNFLRPILDDSE